MLELAAVGEGAMALQFVEEYLKEAICILQRVEYLRNFCGINLPGITMILDLVNEAERLRAEVRFLRR